MSSEAPPPALLPLLERELEESRRLFEALEQGHTTFAGRDAKAIEETAGAILRLYQTVESLEGERQQLLQNSGFSTDRETMDRLLADTPAAALWQQLLETAAEIRKQNEINARIIEGSRKHAEAAFNLLRGKEPASELYSAKGRTSYGGSTASRPIGKA